jgi:hypothetical protein
VSEFDNGSSYDNSTSVDSGASTSPVDSSPITTGGNEGQAQGDSFNPAWQPFLSDLPEFFHSKAKTHFKTWDENYNKLNTEYKGLQDKVKPYEPYFNVDPTNLQYAMNVYKAINSNPKQVHELLTKQLQEMGLLEGPTNSDEQGEIEQQDPAYQEISERQRKLDERQEQIDQYIKQQEYNAEVSKQESLLDNQVKALISKYGESAVDVEDLLQRMYVQSQQGQEWNAEAAFNEQKTTFQRLYQKQATTKRPAPNIIPTNGTPAPTQEKKPEEMSEDERKAYFKQLLDLANAGG